MRINVTINNSVVLSVVYCVFYFILIFREKTIKMQQTFECKFRFKMEMNLCVPCRKVFLLFSFLFWLDDTQYSSAGSFVAVHRENFIDQDTVQHCHQEVSVRDGKLLNIPVFVYKSGSWHKNCFSTAVTISILLPFFFLFSSFLFSLVKSWQILFPGPSSTENLNSHL